MVTRSKKTWIYGLVALLAVLSFTLHGGLSLNLRPHSIPSAYAQDESFIGPEKCKTCHSTKFEEWNSTSMSRAFSDPHFQEEWNNEGKPDECLQCHTTGYDSSTGEYAFPGVTCESCHGPGTTMSVDASPELCGSCHTGEYGKNKLERFEKGIHFNSGVTCSSCHMYEGSHSFEIESKACAVCHSDNDIHSRNMIGEFQTKAFEAEARAEKAEEDYSNILSQMSEMEGRTNLITWMTLGGAVALGVITLVLIGLSLRR